jgi:hypothetical protein
MFLSPLLILLLPFAIDNVTLRNGSAVVVTLTMAALGLAILYIGARARALASRVRVGMCGLRLAYFGFTLRIHDTVRQQRAGESVLMYTSGAHDALSVQLDLVGETLTGDDEMIMCAVHSCSSSSSASSSSPAVTGNGRVTLAHYVSMHSPLPVCTLTLGAHTYTATIESFIIGRLKNLAQFVFAIASCY